MPHGDSSTVRLNFGLPTRMPSPLTALQRRLTRSFMTQTARKAVRTSPTGGDADLYVNAKYFGAIFASAESPEVAARLAATQRPFAARCLTDKAPAGIGWKTIPSWYVIGDADKVIPPDIQNKFATRAKSKVYHVPGGDHPSMIAHPELTVEAIEDAANTVAR